MSQNEGYEEIEGKLKKNRGTDEIEAEEKLKKSVCEKNKERNRWNKRDTDENERKKNKGVRETCREWKYGSRDTNEML